MNSDLDAKMEAFIAGSLDAKEHEDMRNAIENDPAIKAIYEDHILLAQVVDIMVEDDLVEQLKDLDKQKAQSNTNKNSTSFNRWWWFAAILTAGIIITSVFIKRTSELEPTMVAMDYIVYDTDRAIRSQDTLDIQSDQSQINYFIPLREGIEKMENSNYQEARASFQKISEEAPVFAENKEWMIALSHYAEDGKKQPIFNQTLNKILRNPEHHAYQKAVAMNQRINSFWNYFRK